MSNQGHLNFLEEAMSNGTVVAVDKNVLFDQFSRAMELVREGRRRPEQVSPVLQAIIADDVISITPKAVALAGGIFHVTGNFGSVAEALDAGNYDVRWGLAENPAEIPLVVQPVDCKVRAVPLGKVVKTGELFELYPRIVGPMELFTFGVKLPEEQRKAPHFTVWLDHKGQFWFAVLHVFDRERGVDVRRNDPVDEWSGHCRVLVRESA